MKEHLCDVELQNRIAKEFQAASLYRGIDANNLANIEDNWRPIFERRVLEAKKNGETPLDINAEDAHWQWGKKAKAATEEPFLFDIFALESAENTEAVMLVSKGGPKTFSRHPDHKTRPLIYIDLLATAPWNRPRLVSEPIYKGCGRVLFSTAVSLSINEEMYGRVGLHALPGAEAFYSEQMGMTDMGPDEDHQGLRYFELSETQAVQLLASD